MNSSVESIVPFNQFIDAAHGDYLHGNRKDWLSEIREKGREAVSYTHLTLPTTTIV